MNVYVYHTAPNQKTIVTQKAVSDKAHTYGVCNLDATFYAAKVLSDRAFKLYIRMNLHQDGHIYALSPVEIQKSIGMTDKRYRDAVNELIDKGYLVKDDKHGNVFYFREAGSITPDRADTPAKSDVLPGENGGTVLSKWTGNPSKSGGEIVHNITSHNTENNTAYNTKGANDPQAFWDALESFRTRNYNNSQSESTDDETLPF